MTEIQVVPPEVDFRRVAKGSSKYRYRKINAEVAPTIGGQVQYRFGSGSVINLSKTEFVIGFTTTGAALNRSAIHGAPPITAARLETSSGVLLMDTNNSRMHSKALIPFNITKDYLKTMNTQHAFVTANTEYVGPLCPLRPFALAAGNNAIFRSTSARACKEDYKVQTGGVGDIIQNGEIEDGVFAPAHLTETVALTSNTYYRLKLGNLFPHSVCAVRNDLYFGMDLVLTMTIASAAEIGYDAGAINAAVTPLAAATAATLIANPYLQLCLQDDLATANSVRQVCLSGISIPCQVTRTDSIAGAINSLNSRTLKLNLSHGSSLLRVYTVVTTADLAPYRYTALGNIAANTTETDPLLTNGIYDSYRCYVNNIPLTDGALSSPHEVYNQCVYPLADETCIGSVRHWMRDSAVIPQDFSGTKNLSQITPLSGLSLQAPMDLQIDIQTRASTDALATTISFICVFLKFLKISAAGVSLESV